MIDRLPEGKSIGWMQAPPQWIFTHTVRFVGIVRIVIQDGEGFILINKGKPITYYFKHGRIELKGHAALDYFNSHPTIEFNLCKYSTEEFEEALRICNIDEIPPAAPQVPERHTETVGKPLPTPPQQTVQPVLVSTPQELPPEAPPGVHQAASVPAAFPPPPPPPPVVQLTPAPEPEMPPIQPSAPVRAVPPPPPVIPPAAPAVPVQPSLPGRPVELNEQAIKIIGQIKKLNGVVAISVFNDERNIMMMGDVEIEPLLKIARSMLGTMGKITPLLEWGSFVHITLQIPEGNVIVAPYGEYYLCLLTTRTINIGHIRRILRDLQTMG